MNDITLDVKTAKTTIDRNIYGHFAEHLGRCIYEGMWVGEESGIPNTRGIRNDVVAALRKIKVPVLRWPGGCFADEYHWMDGIGPRNKRPRMINTHWGGVVEDNSFGTHEFMELCEQLGCEPYIYRGRRVPRYLQQPCRPGAYGQHCANGQRAAGHDLDAEREDAVDTQLPRV